MAAQVTIPASIEERYDMIRYFQVDSSPIRFNVQNKEWFLSIRVSVDIASTAIKHITSRSLERGIEGAALGGIMGSVVAIGNSAWKGLLGGEILFIETAIDAVKTGLRYGATGLKSGAIGGAIEGVVNASAEIMYRAPHIRISRNDPISNLHSRILTALFKKVAGRDKICCPISGRIFHIPLKTDCVADYGFPRHVFDSSVVEADFEQKKSIDCPFDGCRRKIKCSNVTVDTGTRAMVSDVMRRALLWLASQDSERKDITMEEREEIIDALSSDNDYLKGNEAEIINNIINERLDGRDLRALSNLVHNSIAQYNDSIDKVYRKLVTSMAKDLDKIEVETFAQYQSDLLKWFRNFKINIKGPEQP